MITVLRAARRWLADLLHPDLARERVELEAARVELAVALTWLRSAERTIARVVTATSAHDAQAELEALEDLAALMKTRPTDLLRALAEGAGARAWIDRMTPPAIKEPARAS